MRLSLRFSLAASLTLFALIGRVDAAIAADSTAPPRLVLQLTVDGLRGDLLNRYQSNFGAGGFRYLLEQGTVFTNAHYRHANTETIVGHTTLATGASPAFHGMVGNAWLDRESGTPIYNIEDADYPLLASRETAKDGAQIDPAQRLSRSPGRSPRAILASTFGDELAIFHAGQSAGQSKVFGVSGKDRGAVSMAGHVGKAFWLSTNSGDFVTSAYYYKQYPKWVSDWNAKRHADSHARQNWTLMLPEERYRLRGQDDRPYEVDLKGYGRVFPHNFGGADDRLFYTRLLVSPIGDELTANFARTLMAAEQRGKTRSRTIYRSVSPLSTRSIISSGRPVWKTRTRSCALTGPWPIYLPSSTKRSV